MNEVKLPLGAILQALFPPHDVETVEGYQQYLKEIFGAQQPDRGLVGRPVAVPHKFFSSEELKKILAEVKAEAEQDPETWANKNGRLPKKLHATQPDDPALVAFDNGITAQVLDGLPPVVFENDTN